MISVAQRLHAALVSAFPDYVTGVFSERGYPLDRSSAEAIEGAVTFLDVELGAELDQPFRKQRRSPLEIFRGALEIMGRALADAGVAPNALQPLPGQVDPFGLAPGSSSVLGTEAHEAHLAWGAAKASAFIGERSATSGRPTILLMAADRDDREILARLLESPGVACLPARNPAAIAAEIEKGTVLIAVVDVAHRSSGDAITRLTRRGIPTVVYGDDIDDLRETGLRAQGVRSVVDRGQFIADPTRFVPLVS